MSDDTKIEWADDTVNPWWGCVAVSPACKHCYAESWAKRYGVGWGLKAERRFRVEAALRDLARLSRRALKEGRERRVFIASMADVFEDRSDVADARDAFLVGLRAMGPDAGIVPMLLTKRPNVMADWGARNGWPDWWWAGATVEDPDHLWRIDHLIRVRAKVRFLSCEPLLGSLDLDPVWCVNCGTADHIDFLDVPWCRECRSECGSPGWLNPDGIQWVIVGGESGPKARPMSPESARAIRDLCAAEGVPFHFKQWGEHDADGRKVGKHEAGRLLDGVEHNGLPEDWR